MSYVLITRPQPDAQILAETLIGKYAIPTVCEPLLQVTPLQKSITLDKNITDIIVTSARVFDLMDNWSDYIKKPIWCVGDVTAEGAKKIGFETIYNAHRSAQELLEKIIKECDTNKTSEKPKIAHHFVHISGDIVHLNIAEALAKLGFQAEQVILYKTEPISKISQKTMELLKAEAITVIPFFSQRTAEIFVDLLKKQKGEAFCQKILALAHSETIATILKPLSWAQVKVVPDLDSDKIAKYYKNEMKGYKSMKPTPNSQPSLAKTSSTPFPLAQMIVSSILTAIFTVICMATFGWFVVAPHFILPIENRLKTLENQLDQTSKMINQTIEQQTTQLSTGKAEWNQLKSDLSTIIDRLTKIEPALSTLASRPLIKHKNTSGAIITSADNLSPEDLSQNIVSCYGHLLTSTLNPEEQKLLKQLGFNGSTDEDVLSIPQLLTQLESLDFSLYTDVQMAEKGMMSHLVDRFGIKIRHKSDANLKESVIASLQRNDFSFLQTLESHANLPIEISQWIQQCKKTHLVLGALENIKDIPNATQSIKKTSDHEEKQ